MDWADVQAEDLLDNLREVEWNKAPRSMSDFLGAFKPPKNQKDWRSRVKCNVYYYRTNYALIFPSVFVAFVLRNPSALVAISTAGLATMLCNDSFARSTK